MTLVDPTVPRSVNLDALLRDALAAQREEPHLDYKFEASDNKKLLAHIAAMSNLPPEVPGGRAYLFIGVSDTYQVVGLQEQDRRKNPSADKRELSINGLLRRHLDLDFTVRVHEMHFEGNDLHAIEIPCLGWPWRQLHGPETADHAFWVRHGTSTVRAMRDEIAAQWEAPIRPLRDRVVALSAVVDEQRQVLQTQPDTTRTPITSVQAVHTGFATPERTLLRAVRQDIATYLRGHSDATDSWQGLPYFQLDRLTPEQADLSPPELRARLRSVVEHQEALIRPLVEIVGAIMHDADMTDRVKQAVKEIAQAVASTAHATPGLHGPTYAALRFHPGYLLTFGACAAAITVPDWTALQILLLHEQPVVRDNGTPGRWSLMNSIALRPHMDLLVQTFDRSHPIASAAERARELFQQAEWLGAYLPATLKSRITRHAEVLLLIAHVVAARRFVQDVPFVDAAWLHYHTAQDTLMNALSMVTDRWGVLVDDAPQEVLETLDRMLKRGSWPVAVSAVAAFEHQRQLRVLSGGRVAG